MARDYRAEYARRAARAQELGYKSYRDQRARRASNNLRAGDRTARPRPVTVRTAAGTVTKTAGAGASSYVGGAIEAAAARGENVVITATFRTGAGEYRTRRLDKLPDGLDGGGPSSGERGSAPAPEGAVQVTSGASGMDARVLKDWIEDYYDDLDVWEWLYDLWEFDY